MSKEKRYALTVDLYIYARNDREAMVKSALLTENLRKEEDNQAQVLTLEEADYSCFATRLVHSGTLTLLDNKIIEA